MKDSTRGTLLGTLLLALTVLVAAHGVGLLVHGLRSGDEWFDINGGAIGGLPCAVALGCWTTIMLRSRTSARNEGRLMALSFVCVPLIVLLPIVFGVLADRAITAQGYERCRVETGRRFIGTRYQRGAPWACP